MFPGNPWTDLGGGEAGAGLKPSHRSSGGFPSLGVCPVSLPVLLPAERTAERLPLILTLQPPTPIAPGASRAGPWREALGTGLSPGASLGLRIAGLSPQQAGGGTEPRLCT